MLIETWVFLLILFVFFVITIVSLAGWFTADNRAERAERRNAELTEKNHALAEYTYKQRFAKELKEIGKWRDEK